MQVGGHSDAKDASPEVQAVVDKLRSQVEAKTGKTYSTFTLEKYTTQVVNGLNYNLRIKVSDSEWVHVKAHRAPSAEAEPTLNDVQEGKTATDSL